MCLHLPFAVANVDMLTSIYLSPIGCCRFTLPRQGYIRQHSSEISISVLSLNNLDISFLRPQLNHYFCHPFWQRFLKRIIIFFYLWKKRWPYFYSGKLTVWLRQQFYPRMRNLVIKRDFHILWMSHKNGLRVAVMTSCKSYLPSLLQVHDLSWWQETLFQFMVVTNLTWCWQTLNDKHYSNSWW